MKHRTLETIEGQKREFRDEQLQKEQEAEAEAWLEAKRAEEAGETAGSGE